MTQNGNALIVMMDGGKMRLVNEKSPNLLGQILIRKFKPKTAKKGKEITERKRSIDIIGKTTFYILVKIILGRSEIGQKKC